MQDNRVAISGASNMGSALGLNLVLWFFQEFLKITIPPDVAMDMVVLCGMLVHYFATKEKDTSNVKVPATLPATEPAAVAS